MRRNNTQAREQDGWLYAADRVEEALNTHPDSFYSIKERRQREEFIRFVRDNSGEGIDEAYPWKRVNEVFGF